MPKQTINEIRLSKELDAAVRKIKDLMTLKADHERELSNAVAEGIECNLARLKAEAEVLALDGAQDATETTVLLRYEHSLRGGNVRSDSRLYRVQYVEQLEAHTDAGGSYTAANVRDLINMVKSQDRLMEKLSAVVVAELKAKEVE